MINELKNVRTQFAATLAAFAVTLWYINDFVTIIETRKGVVLADPILALLAPYDLTWLIFALIYTAIIGGIINFARSPKTLIVVMQAYILLCFFRMAGIYLLPLDPPTETIILRDPVVEFFGENRILTRDLFFSGHTSLLFLIALATEAKFLRISFYVMTALVAVFLLFQHVHYTVDILSAPFFAHAALELGEALNKKISEVKYFSAELWG